jgi:hypothetical protein
VGAAGPHFIRAYAKFQNVNHRLETLRAPGGGGVSGLESSFSQGQT